MRAAVPWPSRRLGAAAALMTYLVSWGWSAGDGVTNRSGDQGQDRLVFGGNFLFVFRRAKLAPCWVRIFFTFLSPWRGTHFLSTVKRIIITYSKINFNMLINLEKKLVIVEFSKHDFVINILSHTSHKILSKSNDPWHMTCLI
jgi:hypothetical protein